MVTYSKFSSVLLLAPVRLNKWKQRPVFPLPSKITRVASVSLMMTLPLFLIRNMSASVPLLSSQFLLIYNGDVVDVLSMVSVPPSTVIFPVRLTVPENDFVTVPVMVSAAQVVCAILQLFQPNRPRSKVINIIRCLCIFIFSICIPLLAGTLRPFTFNSSTPCLLAFTIQHKRQSIYLILK